MYMIDPIAKELADTNVLTAMKQALDIQKKQVIEECCKQVCTFCNKGLDSAQDRMGHYIHYVIDEKNIEHVYQCYAYPIRRHFEAWTVEQEQIAQIMENGESHE